MKKIKIIKNDNHLLVHGDRWQAYGLIIEKKQDGYKVFKAKKIGKRYVMWYDGIAIAGELLASFGNFDDCVEFVKKHYNLSTVEFWHIRWH